MTSTALDRTLSEQPGCYLTTKSGTSLRLRPAVPADRQLVLGLFGRISRDDLRFRFLVSRKTLSADDLTAMLEPDRRRAEHILAFETAGGQLVGSLMLVADEDMDSAEVAISVADEWKGRGIGYALLKHAIDLATACGVKRLRSLEDRANSAALDVERTLGFLLHEVAGDPSLLFGEVELA